MTLGRRGTYLNAGLPGTGLSYRTKISPAPARRGSASADEPRPQLPAEPQNWPAASFARPDAVEIRSADVSALTSPGLGELKRLINEAEVKRGELTEAVAKDRGKLVVATQKLRFARSFIVRIFTQKSVPALTQAVEGAREQLDSRTAELEGCVVEVDVAFDDATLGSYAALVRAFEGIGSCQRLWDVTAEQATNRVQDRTVASTSLSRTPVRFDFAAPDIVKSAQKAMRMGEASGRDLYLYPGFLMMRDGGGDFALIEYKALEADFSQSRFIEEETVPSDAEVVGQTWKKANKDGSPDRRFADNYSIPIVRYGELTFRSETGLFETYQFSDFDKTRAFHQALCSHQRALVALSKMDAVPAAHEAAPEDEESQEGDADPSPVTPAPRARSFALDWIALGLGIISLGAGANWGLHHRAEIAAKFQPAPVIAAPPAPVTVAPQPKPANPPHRRHRKPRHHMAAKPESPAV